MLTVNCQTGATVMFDKLCKKGWSSSMHMLAFNVLL